MVREGEEPVLFEPELFSWVMDHPLTPLTAVEDGDVAAIEGDVEAGELLDSVVYEEPTFASRVIVKKRRLPGGTSWELVVDDARAVDFAVRQGELAAWVRPTGTVTVLARPRYGQGQDGAAIPRGVRGLLTARGQNPSEWNVLSPARSAFRWYELSLRPRARVLVYGLVSHVLDPAAPPEWSSDPYRSPSRTMIEVGPTSDGMLVIADRGGLARFQHEEARKVLGPLPGRTRSKGDP
jgi:hypothetical protein